MADRGRPKAAKIVTSKRVIKVLPELRGLDQKNMVRYLDAIERTYPSTAVTDPEFVSMLAGSRDILRPHLIKAAADHRDSGVRTLCSQEARSFLADEEAPGMDYSIMFTIIKMAAAKADTRFFSKGFLDDIAPLSLDSRDSLLSAALNGSDFNKIFFLARLHGLRRPPVKQDGWEQQEQPLASRTGFVSGLGPRV
jgi:hypothetical protein